MYKIKTCGLHLTHSLSRDYYLLSDVSNISVLLESVYEVEDVFNIIFKTLLDQEKQFPDHNHVCLQGSNHTTAEAIT